MEKLIRAFLKFICYPIKYKSDKDGYLAKEYWDDRYKKYGVGYRASGDEGISEEKNSHQYTIDVGKLRKILSIEKKEIKGDVLEIGFGSGVYTELCRISDITNYMGVEISEEAFYKMQAKYLDDDRLTFMGGDATKMIFPENTFDIVICIDVMNHVVKKENLKKLIKNLTKSLRNNGYLILSPISLSGEDKSHWFYNKTWSYNTIYDMIEVDCDIDTYQFRYSNMILVTRKDKDGKDLQKNTSEHA